MLRRLWDRITGRAEHRARVEMVDTILTALCNVADRLGIEPDDTATTSYTDTRGREHMITTCGIDERQEIAISALVDQFKRDVFEVVGQPVDLSLGIYVVDEAEPPM